MSSVAMVSRPRSTDVRAFAVRKGLAKPGQGRLSQDAIDAFNKGRVGAHRYSRDIAVTRHTAKPAKGRSVTRTFKLSDARAWALENGYTTPGARGRLSRSALDAYTLSL